MRVTSLIAAGLVAAGVVYWFVLRHGDETATVATATGTGETVETAGSAAGSAAAGPAAAVASGAPVQVQAIESTARAADVTLTVRGRTEALRLVEMRAETSGRVVSEPLRRGARVERGQVLCRLDPGIRAAELAEAEASLAEAEAEALAARQLSSKGFAAEVTLKAREAALRAAQARLDRIGWDIERLEIRAPFDGVLESDTAELGALLQPASLCATVIDLSSVKITGYVAEQEIDLLAVGQAARVRLVNGVEAVGRISFLSRMSDEATRTYAVEVTLDNPDGRIRDGMTAEIAVDLPAAEGHLIPQSALTLDDDGRLGVRLAVDGIARFAPVAILREDGGGVWVGGLPPNARIIVVGQEFVRDGRAIDARAAEPRS